MSVLGPEYGVGAGEDATPRVSSMKDIVGDAVLAGLGWGNDVGAYERSRFSPVVGGAVKTRLLG